MVENNGRKFFVLHVSYFHKLFQITFNRRCKFFYDDVTNSIKLVCFGFIDYWNGYFSTLINQPKTIKLLYQLGICYLSVLYKFVLKVKHYLVVGIIGKAVCPIQS